jgi:hypothetical protein
MQSFMPVDLRASQFVRGNSNFLAKNTTTAVSFDNNVRFRKYNADIKELTALSGSIDQLASVFESHRGELADIEDKLNQVRDIVATVKAADDAYADYLDDPINNPVAVQMSQADKNNYQVQINSLFGYIEDKVASTKALDLNIIPTNAGYGVSRSNNHLTPIFGGFYAANMIGDNKSRATAVPGVDEEALNANFQRGYIAADLAGAFLAPSNNVSSSARLGRDFSMDGGFMVVSALNQNNVGNGVYNASTAGQGTAFLFNMNNRTTTQQIFNLPPNVTSSGSYGTFYRERFGLVHDFGSSVELKGNLVAIGMADNADPTYRIGDEILGPDGIARTYTTATRQFNPNGTHRKTVINYSFIGENIYDANGEKMLYTSTTKAFNTDGSYKMQDVGAYALGETIRDSDGNIALYTSTDDLRMFNADGTHKIISQGTYAVGDNIRDLNGNNMTYNDSEDRKVYDTDGNWDGFSYHNIGDIKRVQLDSSASTSSEGYIATGIKAGQSRDGYGYHAINDEKRVELGPSGTLLVGSAGYNALQSANSNYQNALRYTGQNPNFLGGIRQAGDRKEIHVTHAAGTERKIELGASAQTNTVGWASSGRKIGQAAIRQEYNAAGSTMRIELDIDSRLSPGSPGQLLAAETNRGSAGFLPNAGDRKMVNNNNGDIQEHGGAVYLFNRDTSNYIREFKPTGLKDGDRFGSEIVIEGDKIFIGAAGDDAGGTNAGAVYVFNVDGTYINKINGSTANAAVGSDGSITAAGGKVAIGRLAGTAGKSKVDVYDVASITSSTPSPVLSREGDAAGDNFGYSMKMKINPDFRTGTRNELLISSSNSNNGDGKLAIYNMSPDQAAVYDEDSNEVPGFRFGDVVVDFNRQKAIVTGNFAGANPALGALGVDFNESYITAKGSDGLIYTYNRNDKALKKVNLTNVNQQKFELVGNMLHVGEYGNSTTIGNRVGIYDVTSNPTIENLNIDLTLRDVANGLSATLAESIANLSVSDQVATILGTSGDNIANAADKNGMDVVLRNFKTMVQNYEDTISKLKKQSTSLIDKKDKLTNTQKFDQANVKEVLDTVYGSQPFNLSSIMEPFDRNIVSSLLP